jgi:hypothetical protein
MRMATLKLASIRMADIVDTGSKQKVAYLAPHLRGTIKEHVQPKMDESNFPSMGPPIQTSMPVAKSQKVDFKATINASLEKQRLEKEKENERGPKSEYDDEGWFVIKKDSQTVREILQRPDEVPEVDFFDFESMANLCNFYEERAIREMNVFREVKQYVPEPLKPNQTKIKNTPLNDAYFRGLMAAKLKSL